MYMHAQCILLCVLLVCCSGNLFIGRISTRPSAGKRSGVVSESHRWLREDRPELICSSESLEWTIGRMVALRMELQRLSSYLAICDVRAV
ncbi:hypothetical protein ANCCAN_07613 [Ancylostoma caninum]|uniref:Secreted protein n=1 Tax=Ancylostoma caninum TaxID=29170 RepID=A0A368GPL9_ANCCA|nr:hypothetical protein ANCCAN_07613 [Ancylostoma caninum]